MQTCNIHFDLNKEALPSIYYMHLDSKPKHHVSRPCWMLLNKLLCKHAILYLHLLELFAEEAAKRIGRNLFKTLSMPKDLTNSFLYILHSLETSSNTNKFHRPQAGPSNIQPHKSTYNTYCMHHGFHLHCHPSSHRPHSSCCTNCNCLCPSKIYQ